MSSPSTFSAGHSHVLHVVIPTTETRVPLSNANATAANEIQTPVADTPGHGHGAFRAQSSRSPTTTTTPSHAFHHFLENDSVGNGHALFRVPPANAQSPTTPRPSARAMRRSSLFSSTSEAQADESQNDAADEAAQHFVLPPTAEAEEPLNIHSFRTMGNSGGGNN